MRIIAIHKRLQQAFFCWGWLLAAVLPLTQLGGRGLFNSLVSIYALWGLLSLWNRQNHLDRLIVGLYLALLGIFLLTIPGSADPERGLRMWLQFTVQSVALVLVLAALHESPNNSARFLKAIAISGGLMLGGLYLLLPWYVLEFSGKPFDPLTQLREDNLPFILPFMLAAIGWCGKSRWRIGAMMSVTLAAIAYAAIAEGRAALLGLIVGLAVFCWAVLNWRLWHIGLLAVLVLITGIAINTNPFSKMELDPDHPLDAFTAGRTILWRQALEHPPVQPWLGVGIGNMGSTTVVLSFELGGVAHRVQHLHNVLLDAWYETGILGVGALLALIAAVFIRLARNWRHLSIIERQQAGALLAAALALAAAGSLSFSYTFRQFACYFFICLGGLAYFGQSRTSEITTSSTTADTSPDSHSR